MRAPRGPEEQNSPHPTCCLLAGTHAPTQDLRPRQQIELAPPAGAAGRLAGRLAACRSWGWLLVDPAGIQVRSRRKRCQREGAWFTLGC